MHPTEGGCTEAIEVVDDDYFPSQVDEAELQQQQHHGSAAQNGDRPAPLDLTVAGWREIEAYIYSDAAVLDVQSKSRIPTPSAAVRRRRWRLANCMRGQNPPITISITDLSPSVRSTKAASPAVPQEATVPSTTDRQAAEAPPDACPPASLLSSPSTPSSSIASESVNTTNALQRGSSLQATSEKTCVSTGESLRDARVLAGGSVKANGLHPPVVAPGVVSARKATQWRLVNAPYLTRGFASDVFPSECRQLLEELPMGAQMEDWSVFVVAATLSFYRRQAHAWASSWWTWSCELTGSGGPLLTGWLDAPGVCAAVDGGVLGMAGRVANASAHTTAAPAAASAATSLLVGVLYVLRILLLCLMYALRGGQRACAHLLMFEASPTLPAKDSVMWTLATNHVWRLQLELVLASIAFILLVMCALVLMRYRKYSQTLSLWEAEMVRRDAAEVTARVPQMSAQQQRLRAPTSAAVFTGGSLHASGSCSSGSDVIPMKAAPTPPRHRAGLLRESRIKRRRGAPDSFANCQDEALWHVNAKREADGGAASSASSLRPLCESSDRGPADALIAHCSREQLRGSSHDRGAAAAPGSARSLGGSSVMLAKASTSLASLHASLPLPLASSLQLPGVSGSAWSSNERSTSHAQRARSLPVTPALSSPSVSDGPGSRGLSWMGTVPPDVFVGTSSSTAKPRRVNAALQKRRLSSTAERAQLIPCLFGVSAAVDQDARAGGGLSIATRASPAFIRDAPPELAAAVTGDAVRRRPHAHEKARGKGDTSVVRDER
ncbi:hypothetical protein LSCM4_06136 [Leishmania orientalis]|uniref:Uncharacterized protein n=1 Tax=Leishmania orientalis TaxID=2249476 RepID=A0A836HP51_9TRYP|nr:hypothetical protein LSCM4_06136 [Leishmania orientalis]